MSVPSGAFALSYRIYQHGRHQKRIREIWYWGPCMETWLHMLHLINIGKNVNTGADSYTAMKRMACNNSRSKAANQSKD
jgi:hypothetical protein